MGDPTEKFAQEILSACLDKIKFYTQHPNTQRIKQKELTGLVQFLQPHCSEETLLLFALCIKNEYHSGTQFQPLKLYTIFGYTGSFHCKLCF